MWQNNEAEALRSWRSALDQIYYHNAYRVPPNYVPKNETERALQESLRDMEMQCKERVDLLEALRKSRKEADKSRKEGEKSTAGYSSHMRPPMPPKAASSISPSISQISTGQDAPTLVRYPVPPVTYPELSRNPPPLPHRPTLPKKDSESPTERSNSMFQIPTLVPSPAVQASPMLPVPPKKTSRTPSPDKKGGHVMLTTLRGPKDAKGKPSKSTRAFGSRVPPASTKAAGLAWDFGSKTSGQKPGQSSRAVGGSTGAMDSQHSDSIGGNTSSRPDSTNVTDGEDQALGGNALVQPSTRTPPDLISMQEPLGPSSFDASQKLFNQPLLNGSSMLGLQTNIDLITLDPAIPPQHSTSAETKNPKSRGKSPARTKPPVDYPSYRTEFPPMTPSSRATAEFNARIARRDESPKTSTVPLRQKSPQRKTRPPLPSGISRRPVANSSSPRFSRHDRENGNFASSESNDETTGSEIPEKKRKAPRKQRNEPIPVDPSLASTSSAMNDEKDSSTSPTSVQKSGDERLQHIQKHLPKGVDEQAAKQIFNEIVVKGDEVHWDDVAGLEAAKKALKEAVVYPFLRPDLFMGLREPARGMLLFGPPGTGKTMLARAVATESRSTFFAISASSLTSKWLGESEKLVRALFSLAKALAPSIIFVDEIDSLLSSRGGSSEHESTRRIKTEFLIQWSDLQRAAAGKQQSDKEKAEGDASRVLVLAATNMPWAIDEAARRRFVRRQYIPLPEAPVRAEQLKTLLGHQKHSLNWKDIQVLVELTDGMFIVEPISAWLMNVLTFRSQVSPEAI